MVLIPFTYRLISIHSDSEQISINLAEGALARLSSYQLSVTLTNIKVPQATSTATFYFTTSSPKFGGSLLVDPPFGVIVNSADYNITIIGWQSLA